MELPRPIKRIYAHMNPPVWFGSAFLVIGFCLFGGLMTETADAVFTALKDRIVDLFGWYYLLIATGFLIFVLWLMISRHGKVRLGRDDDRPEFGHIA